MILRNQYKPQLKILAYWYLISSLLGTLTIYLLGWYSIYISSYWPLLVLVCSILFLLFIYSYRLNSNIPFVLKGSSLFILSFSIVSFQAYLDIELGYTFLSIIRLCQEYKAVYLGFILSIIALISYALGYLSTKPKLISKDSYDSICPIRPIGICAIFAVILFYLFAGRAYLSGGYGGEELPTIAAYISIGTEILFYSCMYFYIRKNLNKQKISILKYIKDFGLEFWLALAVYFYLIFNSGDRGPLLYLSFGLIGTYLICYKPKINNVVIIVCGIIAMGCLTLLGLARTNNTGGTIFENAVEMYDNIESQSRLIETSSPLTLELAGSVRCNSLVIEYIDNGGSFFYGMNNSATLIGIIPMIINQVYNFFDVPSYKRGSSSFNSYLEQGLNIQYGVGTSCTSDLYLDFSILGVIIGLFLFGKVLKYIDAYMTSYIQPSRFLLCSILIVYSKCYYIPRSYFLLELRNIVWLVIFVILYKKIYFLIRSYRKSQYTS